MRYEVLVEDCIEDYLDGWPPVGRTQKTKFPNPNPLEDRKPPTQRTRLKLPTSYEETYQRPFTPINTQLDLLAEILTPLQQTLLSLFIFKNGPQTVLKSVAHDRSLHPNFYTNTHSAVGYAMIAATGVVFERLAYLWLDDQNQEEDTLVLDLGSTVRVAKELSRVAKRYIDKDGMIFDAIKTTPILRAFCEYKTNPEKPHSQEKLAEQIALTQDFISATQGRTFNVYVQIAQAKEVLLRQITISRRPEIILVIPEDRTTIWENHPDITVIKVPFPSSLVTEIAFRCLRPTFFPTANIGTTT